MKGSVTSAISTVVSVPCLGFLICPSPEAGAWFHILQRPRRVQPLVQGHTAANGRAGLETWVNLNPMTFPFLFIRKDLGEKSSKDPAAL